MVTPGETLDSCPLCSNTHKLETLWGTDKTRCPQCNLVYIRTMPSLAQLEAMYSAEFFKGSSAYANYIDEKESLQRNFQHRIHTLLQYKRTGSLFEAGCAYGFFLELARQHWQVAGMDIAEEAIDYARNTLGLDVRVGDFESYPLSPESYDIIAMWDTIEHLYDPFSAVKIAANALRPAGIIAFTTGDIGALIARIQGKRWRLVHPTHLYYFSKPAVTQLLEQNGLQIIHYSHVGNFRTLTQIAMLLTYGRTNHSWRHRLFDQISKIHLLNQIKLSINLFDIMFVIAQKV